MPSHFLLVLVCKRTLVPLSTEEKSLPDPSLFSSLTLLVVCQLFRLPYPLLLAPTLLFSRSLLPTPVPLPVSRSFLTYPYRTVKGPCIWIPHPLTLPSCMGRGRFQISKLSQRCTQALSFKLPHILMGFRSSSHRVRQEWTQKGNWVAR